MSPLGPPLHPAIPPVVVQVQRERLDEEEPGVDPHRHAEDARHVDPESRIQRRDQEEQQPAPQCRRAVREDQQAGKLLGELVVSGILSHDANEFRDHGEHWHAQYKGGEHQMYFGRNPDRAARADARKASIRARRIGDRLQQREHGEVSHCSRRKEVGGRSRSAWSVAPRSAGRG